MYRITEWGPGFRQTYQNPDEVIYTGSMAVTLSDPTKVLIPDGTCRLVITAIPDYKGRAFRVCGGLHGTPEFLGNYRGQDLATYLLGSEQGAEILRRFDALPVVKNFRPSAERMDAWIYEGRTVFFFNPAEQVDPDSRGLPSPTLHPHTYPTRS